MISGAPLSIAPVLEILTAKKMNHRWPPSNQCRAKQKGRRVQPRKIQRFMMWRPRRQEALLENFLAFISSHPDSYIRHPRGFAHQVLESPEYLDARRSFKRLASDTGEVSRLLKDLTVILLQPGIGGLEGIVTDIPEARSIAVHSPTQIVANEKMCLLYEAESSGLHCSLLNLAETCSSKASVLRAQGPKIVRNTETIIAGGKNE
ncbi:hypothetical protein K438DRAFT_1779995 [Mycena galopus ATCC 62051]|nr:hypothetical protein K438DRAFT_1779995 [Mycena galopus ATCC 62051]